MLLFVQPLQRYSHLPCFSWMARLMSMPTLLLISSKTTVATGKDPLTMAIAFAGNIRSKINVNLLAISLLCVLLLTIAWSVGGIYKKISLNILNSSFFLNSATLLITSFAQTISYTTRCTSRRTWRDSSFAVALFAAVGILSS